MFEAAELGRKVSREELERELPVLRTSLLEMQRALRAAGRAAIVVIGGADGAGKGETLNRLHEWLDPRGLEINAFRPPSDEERERPPFWRFWRALPARGKIGAFLGSWYTAPILGRAYGTIGSAAFDRELARVAFFEEMLARDGAILVKFWFHLSKKAQKKRLERLESSAKTKWRLGPNDWKHFRMYDDFVKVSERAIRKTDIAEAPWLVIEAADDEYRDLTVARSLVERIGDGLESPAEVRPAAAAAASLVSSRGEKTVLDAVDLSATIDGDDYEKELERWRAKVGRLNRKAFEKGVSTVLVFEGWDASGKGGSIRRLVSAIDARDVRVIAVAAPTDEERAHHYLWRFWRHIPRAGLVTIFDRSWYGRVLVERVEGFAREEEWKRAYLEINDFEEQLAGHGIVLAKFWMHVSPEEQLRRFEERQKVEWKLHKITEDDWRNREKWEAYASAVDEMVARTSTAAAPWTLVPANSKKFARIEVLKTVCARLQRAL